MEVPEQRYKTKQELVYASLRGAIMRCDLPPGHRIIIDEVSHELGVSHIPVREALQQLQSEGLIINIPHTGATVAPITVQSISEVFVLMEGLESVAMEVAASQLTDEMRAELQHLVEWMDGAVARGDVEAWSALNADFHRAIAAATRMPLLKEMLGRVLDQWDRVRRFFNIVSRRIDIAQAEHHAILDALIRNDLETLRDLARRHARSALHAYMSEVNARDSIVAEPAT